MTDIDISPEAVEKLAVKMENGSFYQQVGPTLRALSSALQQSREESADAYRLGFSAGQAALKDVGKLAIIDSPELVQLRDALIQSQADNTRFRSNSRDTFDAMVAMRNSINEFIPIPSLESDLLQGPEDSVFCATVANSVVSALQQSQAEAAAAYERAAVEAEEIAMGLRDNKYGDCADGAEESAAAIRALTTPDQSASLAAIVSAAEARGREAGMREAIGIARDHTPEKHSGAPLASHVTGRAIEAAILAAIPKGSMK